jgi:DNA-binding YbaB/EbfC family protein
MTKRSFRGRPAKSGGKQALNPNALMAQMEQMQEQMRQTQEALADKTLTMTAGGGALEVTVTGHQRIHSLRIDPDLLDPTEVEMLQDLLIATLNNALEESQKLAANQMEGITGGLDMGGLLGGLGL